MSNGLGTSRPEMFASTSLHPRASSFEDRGAHHRGRALCKRSRAAAKLDRRAETERGFSGDGYVVAGPERAARSPSRKFRAIAPELRYNIRIRQPGRTSCTLVACAPDTQSAAFTSGSTTRRVRLADRSADFR